MEVVLERDSVQEPWGLVWHVQGYKAQKLGAEKGRGFPRIFGSLVSLTQGDFSSLAWSPILLQDPVARHKVRDPVDCAASWFSPKFFQNRRFLQ